MKTIIITVCALFLFSCTKNDAAPQDQLPPATTNGANTAGCYINGELLIPKNGSQAIGGSPNYGLKYFVGNNFGAPLFNDYFAIKIMNLNNLEKYKSIYIHLNQMNVGLGDYIIGQSNNQYYMDSPNHPQIIVREFVNSNIVKTYLSSSNSGIITITHFDYSAKIISGIFHCTLYNVDNPSEKIQISDGRFDINLITLNQ